MIKKLGLTSFFILFHLLLHAQDLAVGLGLSTRYKPLQVKKDMLYSGLGVTFMKSLGSRFFLHADLNYINSRTTNKVNMSVYDPNGFVEYTKESQLESRYNYLSVPVTLNFKALSVGETSLFLSGGLNFDYLITRKTFISNEDISISGKSSGGFTTFLDFGIGALVPVKDKYLILIKPQILYQLKNEESSETIDPYSFGLKLQWLRTLE